MIVSGERRPDTRDVVNPTPAPSNTAPQDGSSSEVGACRPVVHQIYYAPEQLAHLDPAFRPYNNEASSRPQEHEFHVFRQEYLKGNTRHGLSGYLSWKFGEKTGISGADFLAFCDRNPGRDVYFINPFPVEICYGNIWQQGEMWTPGITALAQELLDRCGYGISLARLPRRLTTLAFCNYWIGTPRFWDTYMGFCLPLYDWLRKHPADSLATRIQGTGDPGRNASYFSFIFERLFTTLLTATPSITFASYQYERGELRRRYPDCYAVFLADLYELEAKYSDQPEPLLQSKRHLRFLARQHRAAKLMNRESIRRLFNRQWQRWSSSALRNTLYKKTNTEKIYTSLLYLLNPEYIHWRRDLPGGVSHCDPDHLPELTRTMTP